MNKEKLQALINELSAHWHEVPISEPDLRYAYIDAIDALTDLILELNK